MARVPWSEPADMAPPELLLQPAEKVFATIPFQVIIRVGASWRALYRITPEDLWVAGVNCILRSETNSTEIAPCVKCEGRRMRPAVALNVFPASSFGPHPASDNTLREEYRFDNCRTRCNSSRLHFGGRVLLELRLPMRSAASATYGAPADPAPYVLLSQPFEMCSKAPPDLRRASLAARSQAEAANPGGRRSRASTGSNPAPPSVPSAFEQSPFPSATASGSPPSLMLSPFLQNSMAGCFTAPPPPAAAMTLGYNDKSVVGVPLLQSGVAGVPGVAGPVPGVPSLVPGVQPFGTEFTFSPATSAVHPPPPAPLMQPLPQSTFSPVQTNCGDRTFLVDIALSVPPACPPGTTPAGQLPRFQQPPAPPLGQFLPSIADLVGGIPSAQ